MKHRAIAIVVALILVIGFGAQYTLRGAKHVPDPAQTNEPVRTASGPPKYVRRIATPEDRQRIADRIAAARAGQAGRGKSAPAGPAVTAAPPPPSLPSTPGSPPAEGELARASVPLRDALGEAIPLLAECFTPEQQRRDRRATVQMALVGDDVGTLIDADQLVDENGRPLAPELDACLRATLRSLQLPPLAEGGDLHIQYSFRFDD